MLYEREHKASSIPCLLCCKYKMACLTRGSGGEYTKSMLVSDGGGGEVYEFDTFPRRVKCVGACVRRV